MITFEHVTKRYGERVALDSVSWHMDEGECVVFLGHSGAGKTTILRLITQETQPTSGAITIGTFRGGRLSRGKRALLRRTLGIVYEDFRLLADRTVFENVALAVRSAGRFVEAELVPRVLYALEEVGLQHKQTAFPYELSAGEKQRVAIARAILKNPRILIFDEATSALDSRAEKAIQAELERIARGRTTLVIAHRLSTVMDADQILVLVQGRIVERGTHAQLLDSKGEYARMWALQQQQAHAQEILESTAAE